MSKRAIATARNSLEGETIVEVLFGNPLMSVCGSYGATTFKTQSGKEFVVVAYSGETDFYQVVDS